MAKPRKRRKAAQPGRTAKGTIKRGWCLNCTGRVVKAKGRR